MPLPPGTVVVTPTSATIVGSGPVVPSPPQGQPNPLANGQPCNFRQFVQGSAVLFPGTLWYTMFPNPTYPIVGNPTQPDISRPIWQDNGAPAPDSFPQLLPKGAVGFQQFASYQSAQQASQSAEGRVFLGSQFVTEIYCGAPAQPPAPAPGPAPSPAPAPAPIPAPSSPPGCPPQTCIPICGITPPPPAPAPAPGSPPPPPPAGPPSEPPTPTPQPTPPQPVNCGLGGFNEPPDASLCGRWQQFVRAVVQIGQQLVQISNGNSQYRLDPSWVYQLIGFIKPIGTDYSTGTQTVADIYSALDMCNVVNAYMEAVSTYLGPNQEQVKAAYAVLSVLEAIQSIDYGATSSSGESQEAGMHSELGISA